MKKTLLEFIAKILGVTGTITYNEKEKKLEVSDVQHKKLTEALGEEDYNRMMEMLNKGEEQDAAVTAIEQLRQMIKDKKGDDDDSDDDSDNDDNANSNAQKTTATTLDPGKIVKEFTTLVSKYEKLIEKLQKDPEDKKGTKIDNAKVIPINNKIHSETHLFGIEDDFFALSKPWNQLAASKKQIGNKWNSIEADFIKEFKNYSSSLAARIEKLQEEGLLGSIKMTDIDYSGFDSTGWGQEYVVRQDAIIAYIKELPSVADIFPVVYNVQHKQVMTNSFFEDFSRSYKSGEISKGSIELQPEEAQVYDVMHKKLFTNLKDLEKEYVGYLNREGSQPIKWTFVEWLMVNILKKLQNEWNERRILGYRIEATDTDAIHHLFGSDGVIRRLRKYAEDFKIAPVTDYSTYTSSTILTVIEGFVGAVNAVLPSLNGYALYMNAKHIPWYKAKYRDTYGTDVDFKGAPLMVMDYDLPIIPVHNMQKEYQMWITMPGNVELYEDVPGEMSAVGFERRLESLWSYSYWKEGAGAYLSGKKFSSAALCLANNHKDEYIFMSDPWISLTDDATTCDGSKGYRFKTIANTTPSKVITNITSSEYGIVYRIQIGVATNPQKINKSGNFSEIASNWVPTAVGDYIEVYKRQSDDKFIEVGRQVT